MTGKKIRAYRAPGFSIKEYNRWVFPILVEQGIEVDCSGLGNKWEKCDARAMRECKGRGYKVIARSSEAKDDAEDFPFGWNPAGAITRTMLVTCN